jgi:hypothetical protein
MNNRIIWKSRSSFLLYVYQYVFCIALGFGLNIIDSRLVLIPVVIAIVMMIDAITMRYELNKDEVYISSSLLERGEIVVALEDVVATLILQPSFFRFFSLGTVLLMTDISSEDHPCIKCVSDPQKLERTIQRWIDFKKVNN